ncbi:hypothetical protein L798_02412 [Zootermopsis nevadensis]|uniref:Uncharacterized protein n=1 Tax=Zootermopsis nevadensis TaxID=136037 RepID=A0A067QK06_ZOONE|nr:hypothetical protein L798_02412 [Zootermopsis nevadensis]
MEKDIDVQSEKDSIGVVSDEVHIQSGTSIQKDETEDSINIQKVVPDSYGQTSLEICYDDNQVTDIKVEDVGGVKVEKEDPVMITFPVVKAEHEVSCVTIVRHIASPFVCPHEAILLC